MASLSNDYVLARFQSGLSVGLHIQDVTGLDNHAPASPNGTSAHQSSVLGERELLGGTSEIGDTSNDQAPLMEGKYISYDARNNHGQHLESRTISGIRIASAEVVSGMEAAYHGKASHRTFITGALQVSS